MNIKNKRSNNNTRIESIEAEIIRLKEGTRNGIKINALRKEKDTLIKENIALKKIFDTAKEYRFHGTKLVECPKCGKTSLKRYSIDKASTSVYGGGDHIGKCNRTGVDKHTGAAKCGYEYTVYSHMIDQYSQTESNEVIIPPKLPTTPPTPKDKVYNLGDYLCEAVKGGNPNMSELYLWFVRNCANTEIVQKVFKEMYYIGYGDYSAKKGIYNAYTYGTMFPYISKDNELTNIQRIEYDGCSRKKGKYQTGSIGHKLNNRYGVTKETRKDRCIFGEHLIQEYKEKGYIFTLVESEKTAIAITITSMIAGCKCIGIATGGSGTKILEDEYLKPLQGCIVMYSADADAEEQKAEEYTSNEAVKVFESLDITFDRFVLECRPEEKKQGSDLFDAMKKKGYFKTGFDYTKVPFKDFYCCPDTGKYVYV
jgi:hypothetical protein